MNDIFAEVAPFYIYTGILDESVFRSRASICIRMTSERFAAVVLGIYYGYHSSEII